MSARLAKVLGTLAESGAYMIKGTVTAVSTGRCTVEVNGSTFDKVPYLEGSWVPAVNDLVYLLAQDNFGTIVLGAPAATTAPATPPAPTVVRVDPTAVSNYELPDSALGYTTAEDGSRMPKSFYAPAGTWNVRGGQLTQNASGASMGVWFYSASALAAITFPLASVTMEINLLSGGPVELTLHRNTTPTAKLDYITSDLGVIPVTINVPITGASPPAAPTQVPLSLNWAKKLIAGTAHGITAKSVVNNAVMFAHGSLTFTSL